MSVQGNQRPQELKLYLERFPNGLFADLARERLSQIELGSGAPARPVIESNTGQGAAEGGGAAVAPRIAPTKVAPTKATSTRVVRPRPVAKPRQASAPPRVADTVQRDTRKRVKVATRKRVTKVKVVARRRSYYAPDVVSASGTCPAARLQAGGAVLWRRRLRRWRVRRWRMGWRWRRRRRRWWRRWRLGPLSPHRAFARLSPRT